MLDNDFEELARNLAKKFDCKIKLPESWADYFQVTGTLTGGPGDRRQFTRVQFRAPAVLEYSQTIPILPRARGQYLVYLKDYSRAGIALIHHEQLYPREQMRLMIPPNKDVAINGCRDGLIEVARCTRIQDCCFQIGASFIEG
ncbi:MAG: hypothetical protein HQ567_10575 [Candidatus Nealsonbacteria bacterium]|nr:hypothetical protein [Candidatus Nealsonbacteria bacterium]